MINTILFIVLVLAQIGDTVTTYIGIQKGDVEKNPVMAKVFSTIGVIPGLVIVKFILCTLVYFYAMETVPLVILDIAFCGVVVNNLIQIKKLGASNGN